VQERKSEGEVPCKLCKDDHLSHLCPQIEEASRLLSQMPTVMTNPFQNNQHMSSETSNTRNALSRSKNPSTHEGGHLCINMVKYHIDVATQSCDYGSSQTIIGPKYPPPPKTPLHIENPEPQPCISKGVLKNSTQNANSRATQNFSIVKYLGQNPCAMLAL
jgi:hypothetical protein